MISLAVFGTGLCSVEGDTEPRVDVPRSRAEAASGVATCFDTTIRLCGTRGEEARGDCEHCRI